MGAAQQNKAGSTRTAAEVYARYHLPHVADAGTVPVVGTGACEAPVDTPRRCGLCGDVFKLCFFKRNSGKLGCVRSVTSLLYSLTSMGDLFAFAMLFYSACCSI